MRKLKNIAVIAFIIYAMTTFMNQEKVLSSYKEQEMQVANQIEDILFWIITGIIILYTIFVFNNGEIRFFMFVGIFIGTLLYMLLISKYIIKASVSIIKILKKIVKFIFKLIIFPIQSIYKIFYHKNGFFSTVFIQR